MDNPGEGLRIGLEACRRQLLMRMASTERGFLATCSPGVRGNCSQRGSCRLDAPHMFETSFHHRWHEFPHTGCPGLEVREAFPELTLSSFRTLPVLEYWLVNACKIEVVQTHKWLGCLPGDRNADVDSHHECFGPTSRRYMINMFQQHCALNILEQLLFRLLVLELVIARLTTTTCKTSTQNGGCCFAACLDHRWNLPWYEILHSWNLRVREFTANFRTGQMYP